MIPNLRQVAGSLIAACEGIRDAVRRAFTGVDRILQEAKEPATPDDSPTEDFEEWVTVDDEFELVAPCRVCGEDAPILCDPSEFSIEWHYCGRSPRCCP